MPGGVFEKEQGAPGQTQKGHIQSVEARTSNCKGILKKLSKHSGIKLGKLKPKWNPI